MTLTGVITAHFLSVGVPLLPAVLLGLGAGVLIGVVNAIVVVVMRIDSFIGTLATGSLIQALITMATKRHRDHQHQAPGRLREDRPDQRRAASRFPSSTCSWSRSRCGSCSSTPPPAGGSTPPASTPNAAKLAGVRVDRLRFISLVVSGSLAGATGLVLASTIGSGDPSAGTAYLLPAFAAAFLGATQLKHGRFNAFGTLIAVLLLGTGTTGLALANAPQWAADMFVGIVLIASLAVTGIQRQADRRRARQAALCLAGAAAAGARHHFHPAISATCHATHQSPRGGDNSHVQD